VSILSPEVVAIVSLTLLPCQMCGQLWGMLRGNEESTQKVPVDACSWPDELNWLGDRVFTIWMFSVLAGPQQEASVSPTNWKSRSPGSEQTEGHCSSAAFNRSLHHRYRTVSCSVNFSGIPMWRSIGGWESLFSFAISNSIWSVLMHLSYIIYYSKKNLVNSSPKFRWNWQKGFQKSLQSFYRLACWCLLDQIRFWQ